MSTALGVLVGVILAGLALWILQPLRTRRAAVVGGAVDDGRWKELVDAKHAVYRSILDLETDRSVGKVSDADYGILRHQQEAEALGILAEMDALNSTGAAATASADTLEAEIAAARKRLRPGP